MPRFGDRSESRLTTCRNEIQLVMREVVTIHDCTVLEGHRGKERQNKFYNSTPQRSKVKWPDGAHNTTPSNAIDIAPWLPERGRGNEIPWPVTPTDWNDKDQRQAYLRDWLQWSQFAGVVKAVAAKHGVELISGMDWDGDNDLADTTWLDSPHWQLKR